MYVPIRNKMENSKSFLLDLYVTMKLGGFILIHCILTNICVSNYGEDILLGYDNWNLKV